MAKQTASVRRTLGALLASAPLLGLSALGIAPAQAAPAACQAIDVTSLTGTPPAIPSPDCGPLAAGTDFEIDLAPYFANNWPNLNDFYSIQIANLNTSAANTLEFQDVEFLVTGTRGMMTFTDQAITVWLDSSLYGPPISPALQQGLSDYATSGNSNQINFGTQLDTPVQSKASFKLTGPVTGGFAPAALINTVPISLSANGITSFTGAKIRGKYLGSSSDFGGFSAGLAVFPSNPVDYDNAFEPVSPLVVPSTIYGNAYNVPGPLPLAGAGVALGFSRRLRRRIATAS